MTRLAIWNRSSAPAKPMIGDSSSDERTLQTWPQSTPLPRPRERASEFSTAIPTKAPISACELELGILSHQVPTFQNRAETNNAASIPTAMPPSGGERTSGGINSTRA